MFESYTGSSGVILDAIRTLFSWLDRAAFGLLEIFYQLFFNVASADLFSNDTIMKFYGRVQLIIGVYMMFLLAMTILRGIMNPDDFFGGKDGGSGSKLITRIMTSLIMLTVLVPINIGSPRNEYETQIHNNGLLFGTLYSLQHRILANNTLGRLILGNDSTSTSYFSSEGDDTLKQSSRIFTSTVLKGFYRINLKDEDERTKHEDGKDDAIFNENRVCEDIDDAVLAAYTRVDAYPGDIIGMVNMTCSKEKKTLNPLKILYQKAFPKLSGSQRYVFAYTPLISSVTAIIFALILLSFTIDVAVRAVKLAVLRLLAPIPIISYMDPKGGKDSAFNSWVKTLSSTYLDLFIRLSVVYFVIFLIQDMIVNGIIINHGSGIIGIFSLIIIWIGLFAFAKQAPKFIKEVLGMKGEPGKLFSGFASVGAAAGLGAAIGGSIGSFNVSRQASRNADIANGRDPNSFINRGKHLLSGITGGIAGGVTGLSAWQGAKDHEGKAVLDAIQKRNTLETERGLSGSTLLGRMGATATRAIQGDGATSFDRNTRNIAQKKDIEKSAKDLLSYLEGKGKSDAAGETVTTADIAGYGRLTGSFNEFNRAKAQAAAELQRGVGDGSFTFSGQSFNVNDAIVNKVESELAYAAGDRWAAMSGANDNGYNQKLQTYNESIRGATDPNGTGLYVAYDGTSHTASRLIKTSKSAGGEAVRAEADPNYKRQKANFGASKKS